MKPPCRHPRTAAGELPCHDTSMHACCGLDQLRRQIDKLAADGQEKRPRK